MSFAALIDHQAAKDVHYIYISLSAVFLLFRPPMHPGESKVVVRTPVHGLLEAEVRASHSSTILCLAIIPYLNARELLNTRGGQAALDRSRGADCRLRVRLRGIAVPRFGAGAGRRRDKAVLRCAAGGEDTATLVWLIRRILLTIPSNSHHHESLLSHLFALCRPASCERQQLGGQY